MDSGGLGVLGLNGLGVVEGPLRVARKPGTVFGPEVGSSSSFTGLLLLCVHILETHVCGSDALDRALSPEVNHVPSNPESHRRC